MAQSVTPAVSASQFVSIVPSVLSAGGNALDLSGLIFTPNWRVPIGSMYAFPNATAVASFFGALSQEAALAGVYFLGFDSSSVKPGQILYYQYPWQQPASAYLQGCNVSGLSLAQLQALNGVLTVTIDGVVQTANINLAAATSFSNAAQIIANALAIRGLSQGNYVGSIAASTLTVSAVTNGPQAASFTGSISGTTLTVSQMNSGFLAVGDLLTGSGVTPGTFITALGSGDGDEGTYTVNNAQTVASTGMTAYLPGGALGVGSIISGTGAVANTYISSGTGGTGGVGTYGVVPSQTMGSGAFAAYAPGVIYDSISSAFVIRSGTAGPNSTISFASGALATSLCLTQAGGAVISQGAAQSTPAGAGNAVIALSQNWAQFMTTFEPADDDKVAFAAWANTALGGNRFGYAMWDTNVLNTGQAGPSTAVGAIALAGYSGVSMIHEEPTVDTVGGLLAAFVLGYGASINFNETQGRATAAFKHQTGLAPQIFNTTTYQNLIAYAMNCYVSATTANQAFNFYSPGSVTGLFQWLDSFLNQIWLNNQLQLALMVMLTSLKSIPYNNAGYGQISAACLGPILQAINNGVIQPGVSLSPSQISQVNSSAGLRIDQIISTQGWYLQVLPATAQVRAARGSPPITLWYADGGSVQKISLNSIDVQ